MALTDANGGLSAADVAAVVGNGNNGFGWGNDGAWWLIILFLFMFNGRGFGGWGAPNGYGMNGGVSEVQRGFDQSAVMNGITGITSAVSNGFANAEISRCNGQTNMLQAMNGIGMSLQQCCCDNRAGLADLKYTVASENCADRAAVSDGIRDLMANQNAGVQRIIDQLCSDKIDAKNEKIADLERQLTMANLAASQTAQTSRILADNAAQTVALEQYLNPVPVPAYMVQNPNCCAGNYFNGCGCGA